MVWTYLPLDDLPSIGDIVWCRFPHEEDLSIPGRKPRPVIVQDIDPDHDVGRAVVTVSQGTSIKDIATKLKYEFLDLIIDKPSEITSHGLECATRFDLRKKKRIPVIWCREFFMWPSRASRLYMGKLDENTTRRMNNRLGWRVKINRV